MAVRVSLTLRSASRYAFDPYVCLSCLMSSNASPVKAEPRQKTRRKRRILVQQPRNFSNDARNALIYPRKATRLGRSSERRPSSEPRAQYASNGSLASKTAINAPSIVPPRYQDLHQRLSALQESAGGYVKLSRLQLALRSLESEDPVVRVAFLGLGINGVSAARRLARVLLSDALGQESEWERQILETANDGRSLLLRYGDTEDLPPSHPLVQTLLIPSPFLAKHRLEILITTLKPTSGVSDSETKALEDTMLVPALTTPTSAGGHTGFVRYPVHKGLLIAEGICGAIGYGRVPLSGLDKSLVNSVLNLPFRPAESTSSTKEAITSNAVDVDLATHALNIFRTDKANGAKFSAEWQASRIPSISNWLQLSSIPSPASGLKPAVQNLVASILSTADDAIESAEAEQMNSATTSTVPNNKRAEMQSAISTWSTEGHRDLQSNLSTAFESRAWRRTAWFRLFWRIDDVSYSASDIVRRCLLIEAEQSLAFLSGRLLEAGLATAETLKESDGTLFGEGVKAEMLAYGSVENAKKSAAELLQTPTLLSRVNEQSGVDALFDPPWPRTITLARQQILHTLVPSLHRKAQALLATTLTTVGGFSALAVWLWVATSGVALYEAGAIAAFGLVWSLRRLQKKFRPEREIFAGTVRENGRRALAEVESHLRKVVGEGGRASVRQEDIESRQEARIAVQACREALKGAK